MHVYHAEMFLILIVIMHVKTGFQKIIEFSQGTMLFAIGVIHSYKCTFFISRMVNKNTFYIRHSR